MVICIIHRINRSRIYGVENKRSFTNLLSTTISFISLCQEKFGHMNVNNVEVFIKCPALPIITINNK